MAELLVFAISAFRTSSQVVNTHSYLAGSEFRYWPTHVLARFPQPFQVNFYVRQDRLLSLPFKFSGYFTFRNYVIYAFLYASLNKPIISWSWQMYLSVKILDSFKINTI
jgi:hypothetical protein